MTKLTNLARMNTSTTGSGVISLTTATVGCLSFVQSGVQDLDVVSYGIIDGTNSEVGRGVYGASGSTLTRVVLKSTNSNNPISLSGNATCYITALAEDFISSIAGSSIMSDSTGSIVKHNLSGVTSGSYDKFIVDTFGHIASASSINSSTYLKLDASNDPMTGSLSMGGYALQAVQKIEHLNTYVSSGSEAIGTTFWDVTNHTLSTQVENGVTLQHGEEMYVYGKNDSGSTILNGCAVQVTSAGGQWTAFKYANCTNWEAYGTIGVATQEILAGDFGYVTTQGIVHDLDTSMYDEGKPIYLDPTMNGRMTKTYPSVPNYVVNMGVVEYKHQNHGRINVIKLVVPKMSDLSDVDGAVLNSDGQFYVYTASGSYFNATANINSLITGSSVMSDTSGSIIKHNVSGITTGSYNKVEVDRFGHVISASVVPIPLTSASVANRHLVGYDATTGSFISDTSIQFQVDTERYGFSGTSDTSISFNGTNTFTLSDSGSGWFYYRTGIKYSISGSKSAVIASPQNGALYYFFIDDTVGTISVSNSGWTLNDTKVPVATVYLQSSSSPTFIMADERHTCLIDRRMHRVEHFTHGTELAGACVVDGYTPNSSADADKTFRISNTTVSDEDLFLNLSELPDPSGSSLVYYNVYRTSVTSGSVLAKWDWSISDMPFKYTGTPGAYSYMHYDLNGTSTPAGNNLYLNTYLFVSNAVGNSEVYGNSTVGIRYMILQGRAMYASAALAVAEKFTNFDLSGLPLAEGVCVKQFTWRTNQAAAIKGRNLLISVQDVSANIISTTAVTTTSHNALTGLQGGAIGEYFHLTNYEYELLSGGSLVTGSGVMSDTTGCTVKHNVSGVITGSYNKVMVDTYGHITSASIVAVPITASNVAGKVLNSYDSTTGSFTNVAIATDATGVAGKALYSYTASTGSFANVSIPLSATAVTNRALSAYDASTGSFTNMAVLTAIAGSSVMSDTTGSQIKHNASGVTSGSYNKIVVDVFGHVTSASIVAVPLTATGVSGRALYSYDATTGSFANTAILAAIAGSSVMSNTTGSQIKHNDSGVTTGSYNKVIVDVFGHVTSASIVAVPITATGVSGRALYSYDSITGSFANTAILAAIAGSSVMSDTTGSQIKHNASGVTSGSYNKIIVDVFGHVTSASIVAVPLTATGVVGKALYSYDATTGSFANASVLSAIAGSSVMSDSTGSQVKHNASGVTSGSYNKIQVDAYGHVTSASIVAVPQTVTPVSGSVITGYNATTGSFTSGSVSSSTGGGHIIQSNGSPLATEPVLNFINNEIVDSSGSTVVRNWNKHNQEIVTGTTVEIASTESAIFVGGYTVTGTLNVYGKLVVL